MVCAESRTRDGLKKIYLIKNYRNSAPISCLILDPHSFKYLSAFFISNRPAFKGTPCRKSSLNFNCSDLSLKNFVNLSFVKCLRITLTFT